MPATQLEQAVQADAEVDPRPMPEPGRCLRLSGVSYDEYDAISEAIGERNIRITYIDGELEIMSPSYKHDWAKMYFHNAVLVLARQLKIKIRACGSTTHKRKSSDKGFEPDQAYHIMSIPSLGRLGTYEPTKDVPPDLGIEVDVFSKSLERLPLYADFGIGEVWRYDNRNLDILQLRDGGYVRIEQSVCFPGVTSELILESLEVMDVDDDLEWMDRYTEIVRERLNLGDDENSS
ncbi:Uma2 family endonuclease [Stratiformator vulcanicus]|uniref:Putative restriction endonuclease domain-containing protein n=1 Tax=Stratiformator vulcanicus TaxID=2527980 RepID=A0A517R7S2_9PLAN|nr:Uma2 family endonuclease [Stratiformator vulcanicus]QDT39934.1 hypothetical protein Pan189_43460 [Stratiformator vulcanicus]